jgi:hypothetical protein
MLAGQQIALRVHAEAGQFMVDANGQEIQRLAIKGIGLGSLPFATFVERLCADARAARTRTPARGMLHQRRTRA